MLGHAHAAPNVNGVHLVLYDGVCGLCSRLLQFVLPRDRKGLFDFASLQSRTGRAVVTRSGGNPDDLTTLYVVENYRTQSARVVTKGRAALFVAASLGWPWKAMGLFAPLPTAVLDGVYDLIARNRYRVFGRTEACLVPRSEWRSRFIDI